MKSITDILDTPILSLSESVHLDLRAMCEGTLITGAPGSGRSSKAGSKLPMDYSLRVPNVSSTRRGGLVLTAKAEETQNWIRYARDCGRQKDLVIFNAKRTFLGDTES